jgi:hypothetical protein
MKPALIIIAAILLPTALYVGLQAMAYHEGKPEIYQHSMCLEVVDVIYASSDTVIVHKNKGDLAGGAIVGGLFGNWLLGGSLLATLGGAALGAEGEANRNSDVIEKQLKDRLIIVARVDTTTYYLQVAEKKLRDEEAERFFQKRPAPSLQQLYLSLCPKGKIWVISQSQLLRTAVVHPGLIYLEGESIPYWEKAM